MIYIWVPEAPAGPIFVDPDNVSVKMASGNVIRYNSIYDAAKFIASELLNNDAEVWEDCTIFCRT
jgi:hypothetical protein